MTLSTNLNNLPTNLDLPRQCILCKTIYQSTIKNFNVKKISKDGYYPDCKECRRKIRKKYANTEHGYLTNRYFSLTGKINMKRYKSLSKKEKNHIKCYITKKEFFQLWENHKKKFGYHCRLTGIKMVLKRAQDSKKRKFAGYLNGMSVDRLNPLIGYTKDNIIFVSNKANKIKSGVTKDMCIRILKLYKEKGL